MDPQFILQWMTPVMLTGFALLFWTAGKLDKESRGPTLLGASYLVGAFAFAFELMFTSADGPLVGQALESLGYLVGASLFAAGVFVRIGRRPPTALLVFVCIGGWVFDLYLAVLGLQTVRTQMVTCLSALMFGMPLFLIRGRERAASRRY